MRLLCNSFARTVNGGTLVKSLMDHFIIAGQGRGRNAGTWCRRARHVCGQGTILDDVLDGCDDVSVAKVTGKFQITLPKALVDRCGIRVGDTLELRPIGRSIQIDRHPRPDATRRCQEALTHFDRATKRQRARQATAPVAPARSRGWTREELYVRGRAR